MDWPGPALPARAAASRTIEKTLRPTRRILRDRPDVMAIYGESPCNPSLDLLEEPDDIVEDLEAAMERP